MAAKFSLNIESNHGDLAAAVDAIRRYKEESKGVDAANTTIATGGKKAGDALDTVGHKADEASVALSGIGKRAKEAGVSVGQFSAGATNSFNQLSDVVVSLAGGLNPLTVMIQQGPQLATSFGSVSGTMRVLMGFINPVTIGLTAVAAAAGGLTYSLYKSHQEFDEFNTSLKQTGYQSSLTVRDMIELSAQLQRNGDISREAADSAVQAAVKQGGSYADIAKNARLAADAQDVLGKSSEDAAKWMRQAYDDPTKALIDMSRELGGVTLEQYKHIASLQEAGKTQEAATELVTLYEQRLGEIKATSSEVARTEGDTWTRIKTSIDNARSSLGDYLSKRDQIAQNPLNGGSNNYDSVMGAAKMAAMSPEQKELNRQLDEQAKLNKSRVEDQQVLARRAADAERENATAQIEALRDAESTAQRYYTTRQRDEAELQRITAKRNAAEADGNKDAAKQYDSAIKNLKDQIKQQDELDAKRNKNSKAAANAAREASKNTQEEIGFNVRLLDLKAQLRDAQDGILKVTNEERAAAHNRNMIEELSAAQAKGRLSAEQARLLASLKANQSTLDETAAVSKQLELQKEQNKLRDKAQAATEKIQDLVYTIGMSEQQTNEYLEKQAQIRQRMADNPLVDSSVIIKQVNAEYAAASDARKAKDEDWLGGMKTGFESWAKDAGTLSENVGNAVKQGMDIGTEALTTFVTTGKLNFKSFATDILKMLAEIIVKMTLMKTLQATLGGTSFGSFLGFANGGVFNEPSLSAYRNQVVSTPTPFTFTGRSMFANGGVFGEAGPEAIMPLSRDSSGRLGVKVQGSTAAGSGVVNIDSINISQNGNSVSATATSKNASAMGKAYADAIAVGARNEIQKQLRPGGDIFNAQNARS